MKKFFSLVLIASIVSAPSINSAPLWPWFGRASQTTPVASNATPVAKAVTSDVKKTESAFKNAPKVVFTTIKSAIVGHPYVALIVTVVAADQVARIYSKYYRENLAPKVSFGEKRKTAAPRVKRHKDAGLIE